MKKLFFLMLSAVSLLMAVASCEDEAEYVAPRDISISLSPNPCAPGDTVTATLVYGSAGKNWYWYNATTSFETPTKLIRVKIDNQWVDQYKGSCTYPSFCKFLAPEKGGTYTVSYSGQITVTAGKNLWGERVNCSATLTVEE